METICADIAPRTGVNVYAKARLDDPHKNERTRKRKKKSTPVPSLPGFHGGFPKRKTKVEKASSPTQAKQESEHA